MKIIQLLEDGQSGCSVLLLGAQTQVTSNWSCWRGPKEERYGSESTGSTYFASLAEPYPVYTQVSDIQPCIFTGKLLQHPLTKFHPTNTIQSPTLTINSTGVMKNQHILHHSQNKRLFLPIIISMSSMNLFPPVERQS